MIIRLDITVLHLILCGCLADGARILGVFPANTKSHHNFIRPVLKALADAGHELVVYSPFPSDNPYQNYTDLYLERKATDRKSSINQVMGSSSIPYWKQIDRLFGTADPIFEDFFNNENVKQLLKSKEKFDLVITEAFAAQEFTLILGHIFNSHVVALRTSITYWILDVNAGNSLSLASLPDLCSPFSDKMTISERMYNSFSILRGLYLYHRVFLPRIEKKMKALFPDMPPLQEMVNNVSLIFTNSHIASDYARPLTPNIVHVGGIDIKEENPLPQDIKAFMDEAPDGVILFSLGTVVPEESQPEEYFDMFVTVFKQLRQRVLWRTHKENITLLPDNVMVVKWVPQQDILGHPNCVLFITHGGKHSQHETIYHGVPVVGIPYFLDQPRNVRFYEERSLGVKLDSNNLSERTVLTAIRTVVDNHMYTDNMKRQSRVFRDKLVSPAETVVFWTEHVLRHGARHLRPASTQLTWYQLTLLDVLALFLTLTAVFFIVVYWMFKICFKLFYRKFWIKKENTERKQL